MNEDSILQHIFQHLSTMPDSVVIPPGDDCSAVSFNRRDQTLQLAAVDQLIGGVHYPTKGEAKLAPESIGRKLLARNLSDIAAMGGSPTYCLTAFALPENVSMEWIDSCFNGIQNLANAFNTVLIGGDLGSFKHKELLSLTILGTVSGDTVLTRDRAESGDKLFVTGRFGASLYTGHHYNFTPRCEEGRWLAQRGGATAMIDASDGLLIDTLRICKASTVSAVLNTERIPRRLEETTIKQALSDGEDYELIFSVPPENVDGLMHCWPFSETEITEIGTFTTTENSPEVKDKAGQSLSADLSQGYDHFFKA